MYYNVVVKDTIEEEIGSNRLDFKFEDILETMSFVKEILIESPYHIEILQIKNEED
jgi:hypothetical protein